MDNETKRKIGDFLIEKGLASEEEVSTALDEQRHTSNELIGNIMVRKGVIEEKDLTTALGEYFNMETFTGEDAEIDKKTLESIPKPVMLKQKVIPVGLRNGTELMVACASPISKATMENLRRLTGKKICPLLMGSAEFAMLLKRVFPENDMEVASTTMQVGAETITQNAVAMVDTTIQKAIDRGASDIHMEPEENLLRVRFRVDGTMETVSEFPREMAPVVTSRVKIIAGLDISDRRKPQDGAMVFKPESTDMQPMSLRVSTLPCAYGEKTVLRLLPNQQDDFGLEKMGMEPETLKVFKRIMSCPHGIILVTGPTGSGKSTTLYCALNTLKSDKVNITTIEDPVEQKTKGINQVQVDSANKVTFASALRSILRQDPDIIMVGEIRDVETARLALRAALTGHVVFSTLHTNDSPSAFARLQDMGCENFLLSSAIRGVLAQRLVKKVCPKCAEPQEILPSQMEALGIEPGFLDRVVYGKGCVVCHNTGFQGRQGVFELLAVDESIRSMVTRGANTSEIVEYMREKGVRSLRENALEKLRQGITTPEEVLKVTMGW